MKYFKKIVILMLTLVLVFSVLACDKTENPRPTTDALYFEIINNEAAVTGLRQNVSEIVLPRYYKGYPVTSIGQSAFSGVTTLTSVVLNEGLQFIGSWAFMGLNVNEIIIPGSVKSIGVAAFASITTLTSVTLNEGLRRIGDSAFSLTSITEITIPSTVTSLAHNAFDSNVSAILLGTLEQLRFEIINEEAIILGFNFGQEVSNLIIPTHINGHPVTSIGDWAFGGITTLTSVTLNEGLQTIGGCAFAETSITEITVPSTVMSIYSGAFERIITLTSVTLNEGLQTIGNGAFQGTSITEIVIPSTVTSIFHFAFWDITTLTSVTLNEGLQTIGHQAFFGTSITEITIPSTVTSIGWGAFSSTTIVIRD